MNSDTEKTSKKKITIRGVGGWKVEVDKSILVETNIVWDDIFYQNVHPDILIKLIKYCERHHAAAEEGEDIKAFDDEFVKEDENVLVDLFMGAVYLGIKSLISLTRQALERLRQPTPLLVKTEMSDPHLIREEETQKGMICLKSMDGKTFEVEKSVMAFSSGRIKKIIEENHGVSKISTPIPSWLLDKAIEYCELVSKASNVRAMVVLAATDVRAIAALAEDEKIKSFVGSLHGHAFECLMAVATKMQIESLFQLLLLIDFERGVGKVPEAAIPKVFPKVPTQNNPEAATSKVPTKNNREAVTRRPLRTTQKQQLPRRPLRTQPRSRNSQVVTAHRERVMLISGHLRGVI